MFDNSGKPAYTKLAKASIFPLPLPPLLEERGRAQELFSSIVSPLRFWRGVRGEEIINI
jgi:hypothetical protein